MHARQVENAQITLSERLQYIADEFDRAARGVDVPYHASHALHAMHLAKGLTSPRGPAISDRDRFLVLDAIRHATPVIFRHFAEDGRSLDWVRAGLASADAIASIWAGVIAEDAGPRWVHEAEQRLVWLRNHCHNASILKDLTDRARVDRAVTDLFARAMREQRPDTGR